MKKFNPMFIYILKEDLIDELMEYSLYMARTSRLSIFNAATLLVQKPGLGFAASESVWNKKYNRLIKPEAKPLLVLKPFMPLDVYYEACDTYSLDDEPLPEWMVEKSSVTSSKYPVDMNYELLIPVLNRHGIYFSEKEFGVRRGGEMSYMAAPVSVQSGTAKKEHICYTRYGMIINSKSDNASKVRTIFHEIGHLLCGHLPVDEELKKDGSVKLSIPKREIKLLTAQGKEYEAEKTSEFIMNALGFEYDNSEILEENKINGMEPEYDLGMTVLAADQFLGWLRDMNII